MNVIFGVMEAIIGGDDPSKWKERLFPDYKPIVDWSQVNIPKYNPYMFQLCRNLDGLAKWEFAKRAKLTTKRYSDIEDGNVLPTEEEVESIVKAQTHVIKKFFEEWPDNTPDFTKVVATPKAIDYYQYKIFRDINRPQAMKII